jgi:hypothetical protein
VSPSQAERARTILASHSTGMLATVDIDGRPVVAPVPIVADAAGVPVMVVSNLSTHSSRGRRDTRAAMNIGGRLLIQGDLRPVPGLQQVELTDAICASHPELRAAIESLDWSWLRLEPTRVRITDASGDERWIRPLDVAGAEPDPLVPLGSAFVAEVADKLADQLLLIAKTLAGRWLASAADVVEVDRYGLTLSVSEPAGTHDTRVPFPVRLEGPDDVHAALGALVMAARAAARRDEASDNPTDWPVVQAESEPNDEPDECDSAESDPAEPHTALIHGLVQAAAQTRMNPPLVDDDAILLTEAELYESGGVRPWREGERLESVQPDEAAAFGDEEVGADEAELEESAGS